MADASEENKIELPETAIEVNVEKGRKYSFCTCGQSKKIPYCDNSHKEYSEKTGCHYRSFKIFPEQSGKMNISSSNWKKKEE